MRAEIVVNVTRADRRRLEAIVADRCAPQKHVWRAQIILATVDGCGTAEIIRRSGKAMPVVWTWQARFMTEGVDGLLRDKTRKPSDLRRGGSHSRLQSLTEMRPVASDPTLTIAKLFDELVRIDDEEHRANYAISTRHHELVPACWQGPE
jgi:hypothetical protein